MTSRDPERSKSRPQCA